MNIIFCKFGQVFRGRIILVISFAPRSPSYVILKKKDEDNNIINIYDKHMLVFCVQE